MKGLAFAVALCGSIGAIALSAQQSARPTLLISRQLAERDGLAVGDQVQLATDEHGTRATPFRIAGIYEPTPDPMRFSAVRREVRMHLPDMLDLLRDPATPQGAEQVESVNIGLYKPETARAFAQEVNARTPGVHARRAAGGTGAAGTFVVLERFHQAIAVVTIFASTVFLLALTIMLVEERRETVGILRLMGLPSSRILVQVLLEGLLIAGVGALFGIALALGSEGLINRFFQWRYDTALIFVRITPAVAATCLAIAVPLGVTATVVASWALLRRNALRLARR